MQIEFLTKSLVELKNNSDKDFQKDKIDSMNSEFDKEPQILFLGTIGMKPTTLRAASAIMLFVNEYSILMDCAEGSYGQLLDHFGSVKQVNEIIKKLKLVFITHIHGDHQLGILKIMVERDRLMQELDLTNKLYVITPTLMMEWMM